MKNTTIFKVEYFTMSVKKRLCDIPAAEANVNHTFDPFYAHHVFYEQIY